MKKTTIMRMLERRHRKPIEQLIQETALRCETFTEKGRALGISGETFRQWEIAVEKDRKAAASA